jgi:hypothetical protein
MDTDALNDPELLRDTPLGDLEVKLFHDEPAVWIRGRHEPARGARVVHMVDQRTGVLGALYGKHVFLQRAVQQAYGDRKEAVAASGARENVVQRRAFRTDFMRWLRKDGAREALAGEEG